MLRMQQRTGLLAALLLVLLALAGTSAHGAGTGMVVGWTAPVQGTKPTRSADETTYRVIARTGIGGWGLRVRLSNVYGDGPLKVGAASIARRDGNSGARVVRASLRRLTFEGRSAVTIPAGEDRWSDVVKLHLRPLEDVAINLYVPKANLVSLHAGEVLNSRQGPSQYASDAGAGDLTDRSGARPFHAHGTDVYWADAIEVRTEGAAIMTLGDSLTEGAGAVVGTTDRADLYDRYPDVLARRLVDAWTGFAAVNSGLSGDSSTSAAARLARDVFGLGGVTHVIVLEGSNDVAGVHTAAQIIGGLADLAARLRAGGVSPIGGTIPPRDLPPDRERVRVAVNDWVRTSGAFDAAVDFDAVLRDPHAPSRLRRRYDAGDGVHPDPQGLAAMANAIDLQMLGVPAPGEDLALAIDDVPDRITWRRLASKGLKVGVRVNRRVRVKARLKVVERGRPRELAAETLDPVAHSAVVPLRPAQLERVAGRAEVLVSARTPDGEATRVRRRLTIAR